VNWRRYFRALAATCLLTLVADVVLNAVIFRDVYARSAAFLLPAQELNSRVWLGWAALLVMVAAFGAVLVRGGWFGLRAGLQFGLILAVTGVAGVAGIASIVAWPSELLVVFAVQQFINGLILGVTFGVMYQPARSQ
jgi:hypothetical protein